MKQILQINGMHGLGDNLHLRAILREFRKSKQYDEIHLATSWVSMFWDFVEQGWLKIVFKPTTLRTQTKNAERERGAFHASNFDIRMGLDIQYTKKDMWFRAQHVRDTGSVLGAMCKHLEIGLGAGDFRLPIDQSWYTPEIKKIWVAAARAGKPIMIYRPLLDRPSEWTGCQARNPDAQTYADLFDSIRDQYFVVSIADLQEGSEWIVDHRDAKADLEFHKGELPVDQLAALFSTASLVFCSPGFAVILAQSVGTPVTCVFGGYENSKSFSVGARWADYLGIDPINSCQCWQHHHNCDKRIDMKVALHSLSEFSRRAISQYQKGVA